MKKTFTYILIIVQLIFILFLIKNKIIESNIIHDLKNEKKNLKKSFKNESEKVISLIKTTFSDRVNTKKITGNINLITSSGERISITEIVQNGGVYVYYFKGEGCSSCYHRELDNIRRYASENKSTKLITISDFKNIVHQNIFEKKYGVKAYDINDIDLGLQIEKHREPFYFKLDECMNISKLYRPVNFLSERSETYFDMISE